MTVVRSPHQKAGQQGQSPIPTESWKISYTLNVPDKGPVEVFESLPMRKGSHEGFRRWDADQHEALQGKPPMRVRDNNEIEFHAQLQPASITGGGRVGQRLQLPVVPTAETLNGKLLVDDEHPVTLVAPDGTSYAKTRFLKDE